MTLGKAVWVGGACPGWPAEPFWEAAGLSGDRLAMQGSTSSSIWLLCFGIDAERDGMGISPSGGRYRAFNSQPVNYTVAELYLSGAADLH